jgi:hypothetical protein
MDISEVVSSTVQGVAGYWVELPIGSPLIGAVNTAAGLTADDNDGVIYAYDGENHSYVLEDCEDAWNEDVPANTTGSAVATWFKVGTKSVEFAIAAGAVAGVILTEAITSVTLAGFKYIDMWVKCTVDTDAGDFKLLLDDTAKCVSALETISLPALVANEETHIRLTLANPASDVAIISIGLEYDVDIGACSLFVDDIRAVTGGAEERDIKQVAGYIRGSRYLRLSSGIAADQTQEHPKLIINYTPLTQLEEVPAS